MQPGMPRLLIIYNPGVSYSRKISEKKMVWSEDDTIP